MSSPAFAGLFFSIGTKFAQLLFGASSFILQGAGAGQIPRAKRASLHFPRVSPVFSTDLSTILAVIALMIAVLAVYLAHIAYKVAMYRTGSHATAAKFAELEAEMTDQASAIDGVRLAMTKIRARLNAQGKKKAHAAHSGSENDLNTQEGRDAERAALEKELALTGKLNPSIHQRSG